MKNISNIRCVSNVRF